jgi:hypothetical protein
VSSYRFDGFPGFNEPTFTLTPDILFDDLAPDLAECELRVLLYVVRRTFGFKKSADTISINQMVDGIKTRDGRVLDRGTGMSRPSVVKGAKGLVEKGIVVATANRNPDGGDAPTTYQLRFRTVDNSAGGGLTSLTPPSKATLPPGVNELNPQVETVLQDSVLQDSVFSNETTGRKNVDKPNVKTPHLDRFIQELSHLFFDTEHVRSNQTRARRLLALSGLTEPDFIDGCVYEARDRARHRRGIKKNGPQPFTKNRMPFFFACLEDLASAETR